MAQDKVDVWPSGSMALGVDVWTPDLAATLAVELDGTYNVSSGLAEGIGPRQGMAPLPGHAATEALTGTEVNGLRRAEGTTGSGLTYRTKVFGVVPLKIGAPDLSTRNNYFAWIIARKPASTLYLDVVFGCYAPSSLYLPQPGISSGLGPDIVTLHDVSPSYPLYELLPLSASTQKTALESFLTIDDVNFMRFASISVSGVDSPMRYCIGSVITAPDATHAPEPNFWTISASDLVPGAVQCGIPPEFNLKTFKTGRRQVTFHCLDTDGEHIAMKFTHVIYPTPNNLQQNLRLTTTVKAIDLGANTGTKIGASTAYSSVKATLVEDAQCVCSSSYKAIAIATPLPKIALIQDWLAGKSGELVQWVDPTNQRAMPPDRTTTTYSTTECTAWGAFPDYISGTEDAGYNGIVVGALNTGVLRTKTSYEFAYSLFNKRTNHETNVGTPVKLYVGDNDFCSLHLFNSEATSSNTPFALKNDTTPTTCFPWIFGTGGLDINYYEYRVYYRQLGSFEWLPAARIDAAFYWFFPGTDGGRLRVCTGPIAGLPGGQPGGFVDFSPLPKDNYIDVVAWKDRLWWCSEKAVQASLERNVFAYPGRLSIGAGTSDFRGITVHAFPGQADQRGRLIIWGAKENYIAYFTGQPQTQFVQVSTDSGGEFPIDGSDLNVDPWTTVTAFSSRSAIVAGGQLYWWGPQGIWRDNGTDFPDPLSGPMHPDLFKLYDPSRTREIHAVYSDALQEITWFYPPRTEGGFATHALTYSTRKGNFLPWRYTGDVDAAQRLNIESTELVAGNRTIIIARNDGVDPQRAYFHDERCRSGDFFPKRELMVKQISTPSTGVRRLTLATGYDASNFASIAVGDSIAIDQGHDYAGITADSMIAKVAAIGAGTIDITLPSGAELQASTGNRDQYLPIYHSTATGGLNAIQWAARLTYWAPGGIRYFANWLYVNLLSRIVEWFFVDRPTISLTYRTPTSGGETTDVLELTDNSDGNWQCHHGLDGEDGGNTYGQAIRLTFSGNHTGPEWVLQYLETETTEDAGDGMQQFQG